MAKRTESVARFGSSKNILNLSTQQARSSIKSEQLSDIVDCFMEVLSLNMIKGLAHNSAHNLGQPETPLSREIRILSEVEKIWILYDIDGNGKIDLCEISDYLR